MATFDSKGFPTAQLRTRYVRADIELHRVDQAVPSYEGRIFAGNPEADERTERTIENGYLGSFYVFGKVDCWGEEGHCHEPRPAKFDRRRPPTRYAKVRVRTRDDALGRVVERAGEELTLHIVAVLPPSPGYEQFSAEDALRFERLSIVTYA